MFWKLFGDMHALIIIAQRISFTFLIAWIVLRLIQRKPILYIFRNRKILLPVLATGLLIGTNWFVYIYAVNTNRIVQASMGYYINPLFNVFLGLVFLKEKLNTWQTIALVLAACGVGYMTWDYGRVPWIALYLAFSFGMYGLIKKTTSLDSLSAISAETLLLLPVALLIITGVIGIKEDPLPSYDIRDILLFAASGAVTVFPLYCFAQGAKRIPYSTVGFMQYIAPTFMLLIGTMIFHEAFTPAHIISFGLIWAGLIVYSFTLLRMNAQTKKQKVTEE